LERRVPSDELVDILAVCLISNHYHLLAQEKINGGVGIFTNKIGTGYTHYFNQKNERSGVLFQGRSKRILVKDDAHFIHLPYYVLANSLKLIEPQWKESGIRDKKKALKFLDNYKWGSFRDIVSDKKGIFSDIVNRELFLKVFGYNSSKQFEKDFDEWLGGF